MAHDGAGTAIAVDELEKDIPDYVEGFDPMEVRWYMNAVVRDKIVDRTRIKDPDVKYAKFHPITRFNAFEEFHSVDEGAPRQLEKTVSAHAAQMHLEEALGGKDELGSPVPNKQNWGIQIGFYGEKDAGKMAIISKTLLPSLPEIREFCTSQKTDNPIGAKCDGQEDTDFDERQTCPMCWSKWITSGACQRYMAFVAENGKYVYDISDVTSERLVRPPIVDLKTALPLVQKSLQTGLLALQRDWQQVVKEFDQGERKAMDEGGHINGIRKDLHQVMPQNRQLEMVKQYAAASQGSGNTDAILASLAQSQAQTNQLLGLLVGGGVPITPVSPVTETVPALSEPPVPVAPISVITDDEPSVTNDESPAAAGLAGPAARMEAAKNKE